MLDKMTNNNQVWTFLNFKNNKILYNNDNDKIQLFLELQKIDEIIKKFNCKKIISKYSSNILNIKKEVLNNEKLRKKVFEELNKKNIENDVIYKKNIIKNNENNSINIIKKQLGL